MLICVFVHIIYKFQIGSIRRKDYAVWYDTNLRNDVTLMTLETFEKNMEYGLYVNNWNAYGQSCRQILMLSSHLIQIASQKPNILSRVESSNKYLFLFTST